MHFSHPDRQPLKLGPSTWPSCISSAIIRASQEGYRPDTGYPLREAKRWLQGLTWDELGRNKRLTKKQLEQFAASRGLGEIITVRRGRRPVLTSVLLGSIHPDWQFRLSADFPSPEFGVMLRWVDRSLQSRARCRKRATPVLFRDGVRRIGPHEIP